MNGPGAIDELLDGACPSIRYRLRREVLGEPPTLPHMLQLQAQILRDDAVRDVIGQQQADGWLGWSFHGEGGIEAGIRLLREKGVETGNRVLRASIAALVNHTDRLERGIGRVGRVLDDRQLGGSLMIRAWLLAQAGIEGLAEVEGQVSVALEGFRMARTVDAIDDIVEPFAGKLVLRPGVLWPSIYHLRLLAFTHGWRTAENRDMVVESIGRLAELSPVPNIYIRDRSQLMAPASFAMDDFRPDMAAMSAAEWMRWFHRFELLSRLGVVTHVAALRGQLGVLEEMLAAADGRFTRPLRHDSFKEWGAYNGLMLERDWRSPSRRIYDLTFRSMLIVTLAAADQADSSPSCDA